MEKRNFLVFIFYLSLGLVAYRDCFDIFIPGDNYSFLSMFERDGFASILKNAQEGAPYFIAYPILFFLYKLFGIVPFGWMSISILLHALNAFFVFLIAKRLLNKILTENNFMIAIFSGLIFLIAPYQTENVLWTSISIRWLFHAGVTLAGIYLLVGHLENSSLKKIVAIHFLFLLGLFSYEFTFICPLIYSVLFMLFKKLGRSKLHSKTFLTQILAPQLLFILFYFLVCKLVSGHWLWHAGTVDAISQTTDYSKTLLKYFAKFFLFYRYLPLGQADGMFRALSESKWITGLAEVFFLALITVALWSLIKTKKESGYILTALFACFIISLLPVLPLDSSFLKYIYPDRYGYLPSVFFYIFWVSALYFVLKKIALPVLIVYSVLCWMLLAQTIPVWDTANTHCNTLTLNFKPFQQYDRVYVLNVPAYYKGVAAFRSAFAETVFMKNDFPAEKVKVISGFYHEAGADTITSVVIKENTVTVSGPQKDTPYFSTKGGWARSYETEEYKVIFDPTGCSYTLSFKQKISKNSAFIYVSNGTWKKAS